METTGPTAIEKILASVVLFCWTHQVTLKSDYARGNAHWIAAAISDGYLTTKLFDGCYSNHVLPTPVGLEFMEEIREEQIF